MAAVTRFVRHPAILSAAGWAGVDRRRNGCPARSAQPVSAATDAVGVTLRNSGAGLLLAAAVAALAGCGASTTGTPVAVAAGPTTGSNPLATKAPGSDPIAKTGVPLSVAAAGPAYLAAVAPANRAKFAMYDVIGGTDQDSLDLVAARAAVARYVAATQAEVAALRRPRWPDRVAADVAQLVKEKQTQLRGYQLVLQAPRRDFGRLYSALQVSSGAAARIRAALNLPPTDTY